MGSQESNLKLPFEPGTINIPSVDIKLNVGTPKFDLLCLLYLIKKHPEHCIYFPPIKKINNESFRISGFTWFTESEKLFSPDGFWDFLNQCKDNGVRLVITYLNIDTPIELDINHATMIVFDNIDKTVERYDSNGRYLEKHKGSLLDKKCLNLFQKNGFRYISPLDFCPKMNVQTIQYAEKKVLQGDPGGWCSVWSLFYADMRLTYPEEKRDRLISKCIEILSKKKQKGEIKSFSNFIQEYAYFVVGESEHVNNPEDFMRILKDYKYYKEKTKSKEEYKGDVRITRSMSLKERTRNESISRKRKRSVI